MDAVQRAQRAVHAGKEAQVILGPVQILGREAGRIQAAINLAIEGKGGLFLTRLFSVKRLEALAVQLGQIIIDLHHRLDLGDRQPARGFRQDARLVDQRWLGPGQIAVNRIEIHVLGRRQQYEHRANLL